MTYSLVDLHGATMAATAIASLAALVGLFTVLEAATATAAPPSPAFARALCSRPA